MPSVNINEIVRLRNHLKINQPVAAEALGIGRTTYIQREKNGDFTEEELTKLAVLLKTNVSNLYSKDRDIEVNAVIGRIAESSVRTEAMLSAVLVGLSKVLEKQTDIDAAKILADLIAASNLESSTFLHELKQLKGL